MSITFSGKRLSAVGEDTWETLWHLRKFLYSHYGKTILSAIKKNKVWLQRGIQFLSDIVDENGDILAFENLKQKFRLEEHTNFLDCFSLIKSLPSKWKKIIKSQTQSKNTDPLITKLCRAEKAQRPSQVIYQELRKSVAKRP